MMENTTRTLQAITATLVPGGPHTATTGTHQTASSPGGVLATENPLDPGGAAPPPEPRSHSGGEDAPAQTWPEVPDSSNTSARTTQRRSSRRGGNDPGDQRAPAKRPPPAPPSGLARTNLLPICRCQHDGVARCLVAALAEGMLCLDCWKQNWPRGRCYCPRAGCTSSRL